MNEPTTTRPAVELSDAEKALVRAAVRDARAIPSSVGGEEQVRRVLRRRRELEDELLALHNPARRARPWLWTGWVVSSVLAGGVVAATLWRAIARFEQPVAMIDEPVALLLWSTGAFLAAWIPALVGVLRARAIHRYAASSEVPDPAPALKVYDVNMVRAFLREDEG